MARAKRQFTRLLHSLKQDREPVGTLEEVLVEKIAYEYWRLAVAAGYEADDLAHEMPFRRSSIERITRYQTTINRWFNDSMNQLERLRRLVRQCDRLFSWTGRRHCTSAR